VIPRSAVVAAAREWLGTPFHHQGRLKGVGVDCVGVVIGVAKELGISDFDVDGYGHRPDSREMERLARKLLAEVPADAVRLGDVLLIEVDSQPQHLAFVTPAGMLHAYAPLRCVVEHRIDASWRARIIAAFSLPGVE